MNRRYVPHAFAGLMFLSTTAFATAADIGALVNDGVNLMQQGKFEQAISALEQAVAADPSSSLAYTRLGGARMMKHDYPGSVSAFQSAIGADPDNAEAYAAMGISYMHMGWLGPARAALESAVRLDADKKQDVTALLQRIDQRMQAGEAAQDGGSAH